MLDCHGVIAFTHTNFCQIFQCFQISRIVLIQHFFLDSGAFCQNLNGFVILLLSCQNLAQLCQTDGILRMVFAEMLFQKFYGFPAKGCRRLTLSRFLLHIRQKLQTAYQITVCACFRLSTDVQGFLQVFRCRFICAFGCKKSCNLFQCIGIQRVHSAYGIPTNEQGFFVSCKGVCVPSHFFIKSASAHVAYSYLCVGLSQSRFFPTQSFRIGFQRLFHLPHATVISTHVVEGICVKQVIAAQYFPYQFQHFLMTLQGLFKHPCLTAQYAQTVQTIDVIQMAVLHHLPAHLHRFFTVFHRQFIPASFFADLRQR